MREAVSDLDRSGCAREAREGVLARTAPDSEPPWADALGQTTRRGLFFIGSSHLLMRPR